MFKQNITKLMRGMMAKEQTKTQGKVFVFLILSALTAYKILRARLGLISYLCPPIKDLHTSTAICQSVCTHLQSSG